ncbi:hypothetical protein HPB47_014363 [Ixodes persulcatus]|uniref:Uncharacterized protein n=1 Tax=Ixodes persulcatus TaxID=34615 RepID=A0AC60QY26_IXOPE|nr:hypothetical protein HPB47_014363 [Ixodes persulcatus]
MRTCNDEETGPSTDSGVPREHNESEDNSPDGQSETTGHNSGLRTLNPLNGNRESPKANDVCLAFKPISARRLGKRPSGLQQPSPAPDENDEAEEACNRNVLTVWTSSDFEPPDTTLDDNHMTLEEVAKPWENFRRYFPYSLFEEFAGCTNIYGPRTSGTNLETTSEEIKTFFGMMMIMGTPKFPRIRMYWQPATQIPSVSEAMGVNRFFKIRSALHVTETSSPRAPTDKFRKVRPQLDTVRQRCLELAPSENNSIDEQIIPFTGRVSAKQFLRNKPNLEGVDKKDFLLSLYPLSSRTKKWTVRVIPHLDSFALGNSWQEYLQGARKNHIQPRKVLDKLGFQNNAGLALILTSPAPKNVDPNDPPRKAQNAEPRPVKAGQQHPGQKTAAGVIGLLRGANLDKARKGTKEAHFGKTKYVPTGPSVTIEVNKQKFETLMRHYGIQSKPVETGVATLPRIIAVHPGMALDILKVVEMGPVRHATMTVLHQVSLVINKNYSSWDVAKQKSSLDGFARAALDSNFVTQKQRVARLVEEGWLIKTGDQTVGLSDCPTTAIS